MDVQAYLSSIFVLKQIEKSLKDISQKEHEDFRVYILKAKAKRKIKEVLMIAKNATPRIIHYGTPVRCL
jgi:hypothetical protein